MRNAICIAFLCALIGSVQSVRAQNRGFQLHRYEPTPSGSLFLAVEHPYYSGVRSLAAGLTLQYAHSPLRYGESSVGLSGVENVRGILDHQIVAHLDVAASLADRVLLAAALPLILLERGQAVDGITPIDTIAVSDPRLSIAVRAYRHPHRDPFSVHATAALWIPVRAINGDLPQQSSDQGLRLRAGVVLSGVFRSLIWSGTLAFQYRSEGRLGTRLLPEGASVGPEAQIGLAAAYLLPRLRLSVGPEVMLATSLLPSQALQAPYTSLEILASAQRNFAKLIQVGLAVGIGTLSAPGTPDARLLLRISYAPLTRDRDQDGIRDEQDACPDQKGVRSDVPSNNGCPLIPDRDCDGVPDVEDECPDEPEGRRPDPNRSGCPRTGLESRAPVPTVPQRPHDEEPEPPPASGSGR